MRVFIVMYSDEEYLDYTSHTMIIGVFNSKEKAREFIKEKYGDEFRYDDLSGEYVCGDDYMAEIVWIEEWDVG